MRFKRLLLLSAAVSCGLSFSEPKAKQTKDWFITLVPNLTYIDYSNSDIKKWGWSANLYGSLSLKYGTHVLEGMVGTTHLEYKNSNTNWNQSDYVIAYTNYQFFPWYGKVGFHYLTSPSSGYSSMADVYFADIGYIKRYAWDGGLFVSYSNYRNNVETFQAQVHGGFYRWRDYYRGFYFSGDLTWINLNSLQNINSPTDIVKLTKENYYSAGVGVTYFTPRYKVYAHGWLGERVLAVDGGGFVVYNLSEKYYGGATVGGTYYWNKKLFISLDLGYSTYKELSSGNTVGTFTSTLSVGYSF